VTCFEYHHVTESPPSEWLRLRLKQGDRLGYDPWLHTIESVERLQAVCAKVGATLVSGGREPGGPHLGGPAAAAARAHRPPRSEARRPAVPDKRREIGELLARDGVDAVVLTAPDSVAWLLNIRGSDVAHTPIPLVFAVAHRDATVDLFVDAAKITPGSVEHLGDGVRVLAPAELGHALDRLGGRAGPFRPTLARPRPGSSSA
jgi:Xaa-Pro aminopeptidase